MIKEKKCKGQNTAKDFDGCGAMTKVEQRKFGLCKNCYRNWLLESDNGQAYVDKMLIKNKSDFERKQRAISKKKDQEQRENLKTISQLISEAKKPFQKWIRMRDANRSCISCQSTTSDIWDAGHYFKAELYTGLIFNENNVHKQCRKCNTFLGGNEINYRRGLIERFGIEYVNQIESLADVNRTYKFTRDQLQQIKNHYLDKINNKEF